MTKYTTLYSAVYGIFGTTGWKNLNIPTYPQNFTGPVDKKFIRVSVLSSGNESAGFPRAVSGMVLIDIFTEVEAGTAQTSDIADKLDQFLQGRAISTNGYNLQFKQSTLQTIGIDPQIPSLYKSRYSIQFNLYKVT